MTESLLNAAAEATTAPQESAAAFTEDAGSDEVQNPSSSSTADATPDSGEGTTPPEESVDGSAKLGETEEDVIEYRFNHETKKVSRKEAPALIQKLLKSQYDHEQKNTPLLDRLRFLAEASGKELSQLISDIEQSYDRSEFQKFLKKTNGNEEVAHELAEISKKRRAEKFRTTAQLREEEEKQAKETLTKRMGEELHDLQAEFPEIADFSGVPDSVVEDAKEKNISLLDSYLRYLHRNAKKAAAQKAQSEKAAARSAGPLHGAPDSAQKVDEQSAAFSTAFRKNF